MPSRGSAAADDLLARVRTSLEDGARVTRDTLAVSGEAVAGAAEARELVESVLFPETAAT
jgi:hypothetical protein